MLSKQIQKQLISYLREDTGSGDITSAITPSVNCTANIIANENCILCGTEEVIYLAKKHGLKTKTFARDGKSISAGRKIIEITGNNRKVLSLERVCLNIIGRMSGVATLCSQARKKMPKRTILAVTRKTVPGFQLLDKKAAQSAGLWSHRKNLAEMILLKENHLKFFPTVLDAADKAKQTGKKFEIEVETEWDAIAASLANPDIIMLDNFSAKNAKFAIENLRKCGFRGKIELSGGITIKNLSRYSRLGADIISMGELTKKAKIMDFSLDIADVKK